MLRKYPPFECVHGTQDRAAALLKAAVMNLKKTLGGATADSPGIVAFAREQSNQAFIRSEIEIIEPDVIICCGPSVYESVGKILKSTEALFSPNRLRYFKWASCIVVDYYHPAYRVSDAMLYSYLIGELRELLPSL
ncbi:MAG: hypothetical protein ACRD11_15440 [Terriglobia bacterium]